MRSAFCITSEQEKIWNCPVCRGNCFGSGGPNGPRARAIYYCSGPNEQRGCGYWESTENGMPSQILKPVTNGTDFAGYGPKKGPNA